MRTLLHILFTGIAALSAAAEVPTLSDTPLKNLFGNNFLMAVAINDNQSKEIDTKGAAVVKHHFNTIVAENCMKCEKIHPGKDTYYWEDADRFMKFAEDNNLTVIGHCLIWHSQLAPWFPYDDEGNYVTPEELKKRMRDHIHTVMGRYKGRIKGWDVVNEAIVEDGSYRKSPFYEILGEEFIPLAFQYAHEADPDAELYINDYGMNVPGRRATTLKVVRDLKARGLRIDAVGLQAHMGIDYPSFEQYEETINEIAATGCKVMITEWEMSALPTLHRSANVSERIAYEKQLNPYPDALPADIDALWNNRMEAFWCMFMRHSDVISRLTVWGVSDGDSWKNGFPVPGRKDYPLLFDRDYRMKPFLKKLSNLYDTPDNRK